MYSRRHSISQEFEAVPAARAVDTPVQLLLPLALFGGGSYRTRALSRHTDTQIAVMQKFLDVGIDVSEPEKDVFKVVVDR